MHLGLDVGTGTTKLTRYQSGTRHASRMLIVPTAVSYQGLSSRIPAASPGGEPPSDSVRCDGFPAMLGEWPATRVTAWGGRTPGEVAQTFLRRLLIRGTDEDVPRADSLVVTVPATGPYPAAKGSLRDSGTELLEILYAIGYPPQRVLPAPVAALAFLQHEYPELTDATRFAVCDVGAGGMSFALCTSTATGARIIDVLRMTGAAAWNQDTMPGTATDGRPVTLTEGLVAEMARIGGAPAAAPGDGRSVHRWRALEAALASAGEEESPGYELRKAFWAGGKHPGFGGLRFADLEVTGVQVFQACARLAEAAGAGLSSVLARQEDPEWRRFGADATRIVLIGGLTGLGPIRAALLQAAGLDAREARLDAREAGHVVVEPGPVDRLCTAALGAALIAAGKADPSTRFPYAVRLLVYRAVQDRIEPGFVQIAAAGTIVSDQAETPVKGADGRPVVVTVPVSSAGLPLAAALPIQLVPREATSPQPAEFKPAPNPPPGDYRISVAGDPAGAAIVLRHVRENRMLRYVLRLPEGPHQAEGIA
ncbi:MAG TPA: hypothetical protein VKU77_39255 [Streptosporangiaceae bacterium]|nr:hypothetical protein [Streptosporangiaceae bacterium]